MLFIKKNLKLVESMKKTASFLTLLLLFVFIHLTFAQTQCDELVKYRDYQLYKDYEDVYREYDINKKQLERYKNYKKELEAISFGKTSKTIGEIAMSIEAACTLTKDMLGIIPAAKAITTINKVGFVTVDVIQKKFIEGKKGSEVVSEIAIDQIKTNILDQLNPAFAASSAMFTYYQKIKEMNEFSKEASEYLDQVKEQMKTYEDAIAKYQQALDEPKNKIAQINEIKNAIDKYCGSKPVIKVVANMDCKVTLDNDKSVFIVKNDKFEFSVEKGLHIINALSTEGNIKWDTTLNISKQEPITVYTNLKKTKETNSFTDSRDGKTYKTVTIGSQKWLAENLNYNAGSGSWCYDNSSSNCNRYGRLYDWQTARSVCPSGWRLPSKSDFETLLSNAGGSGSNAYNALKEDGSSGFSALLGGWRYGSDAFSDIGISGSWWSSSEDGADGAWYLGMHSHGQGADVGNSRKELGFSVRCLQD